MNASGPAGRRVDARVAVPITTVWADPGAAREVDEPIMRDIPDAGAWTRGLDLEARLGLHGRTVTQALLGEDVLVVSERDGWSAIRLPQQPSSLADDGYPGWVRSAHLVAASGEGPAYATHTDPATAPIAGIEGNTAAALAVARLLEGSDYLWGGLSGNGVDCSGLVHLAYRSLGVVVPRDAHDQERAARAIELDDAKAGDAVYFANESGVHHVGLVAEPGLMLHAPRTGATVRFEAIHSPAYEGERILARRLLSPTIQENS